MGRLPNEGFRSLLRPGRPRFYRVSLSKRPQPHDGSRAASQSFEDAMQHSQASAERRAQG